MRIIDTYGKLNDSAVGPAKRIGGPDLVAKAAGQRATHKNSAAQVKLSTRALELAKKSTNDAETAKVDALRAAIDDGSFHIDRQAIAKRLVDGG